MTDDKFTSVTYSFHECYTRFRAYVSPVTLDFVFLSLSYFLYSRNINNGVYRSGFATSQEAYDSAVRDVFNALDKVSVVVLISQIL